MIRLFAPENAPVVTIALPDAEWGDVQRLESTMQLYRSMNGEKIVTHVRKLPNIRSYEISLVLTRLKALEFINFYDLFGATKMRILLDKDTTKIGYMKINPMELEFTKRAVQCDSMEEVNTKFDFESIQ